MTERHKVNIYDSTNRQRLLGYIYSDRLGDCATEYWRFAVCRMLPVIRPGAPDISYITLKVSDRQDPIAGSNGWIVHKSLVTSAKLEDLLSHRDFYLPGESDRIQYERLYSYR